MKTRRLVTTLFASAGLLAFLSACQPVSTYYLGNFYDPALTIPLEDNAEQDGTWQTFHVTVNYRYQAGDTLLVAGTATLGDHYQALYERLVQLDLYLFLLDDDTRVLVSRRIDRAFAADTDLVLGFSETVALPANTTQIAFGYQGRVTAGDPEPGGNTEWFHKLPLTRQ